MRGPFEKYILLLSFKLRGAIRGCHWCAALVFLFFIFRHTGTPSFFCRDEVPECVCVCVAQTLLLFCLKSVCAPVENSWIDPCIWQLEEILNVIPTVIVAYFAKFQKVLNQLKQVFVHEWCVCILLCSLLA